MRMIDVQRGVLGAFCLAAVLFTSAAAAAPAPQPQPGRSATTKGGNPAPVDVNTAGAAELTAVPGIGKVLAERIVEFREKNGPFGQVDDLLKVRGIGEKSLERLRPYLVAGQAKAR